MRNLPYGWPALATVAAFACSSGAPAPRANAGSGSSGSAGGSGSSATSGSIGSGSSTSGILNGASGSGSAGGGVISSGSASSGVMSSGASGGASSGSASSSGATTTGGETDDASGDSAVESSEGGGDCATAGYQLCDDFEGVAAGAAGSVWTIDNKGYTVETVTTQAHSGTHSVHVQSTGSSGLGYIVESMTFPATDFWGRAYLMFMAPGSGHEVFAAMDSTPSDDSANKCGSSMTWAAARLPRTAVRTINRSSRARNIRWARGRATNGTRRQPSCTFTSMAKNSWTSTRRGPSRRSSTCGSGSSDSTRAPGAIFGLTTLPSILPRSVAIRASGSVPELIPA